MLQSTPQEFLLINLVICDDNKATADMIAQNINWESIGCRVSAVNYDGEQGLTSIIKYKPDLIITDINMPGLDGLEMIKLSQEKNPSVKFIFITAHDNFEYAHEAIKLHAFDYLLKPFAQTELFYAVSRVVEEIVESRKQETVISIYKNENTPFHVKRIIKYLENHLSENISLETLSKEFKISSSHIGKSIKQFTGKSYSQLMIDLRLKKAKFLLSNPQYNINEISEMVGYKNYISFYKMFLREYKIPPTDYRNKKIN